MDSGIAQTRDCSNTDTNTISEKSEHSVLCMQKLVSTTYAIGQSPEAYYVKVYVCKTSPVNNAQSNL